RHRARPEGAPDGRRTDLLRARWWSTWCLSYLVARGLSICPTDLERESGRPMARELKVEQESFPIAGKFNIARGSKTHAEVLTCTLGQDGRTGRGECVPYARYGESIESVRDSILSVRDAVC